MYSIIIPILHLTKLKHIGVLGTAGGIIFLLGNLTLCSRALKTFIYFDSVIALLWKQRKGWGLQNEYGMDFYLIFSFQIDSPKALSIKDPPQKLAPLYFFSDLSVSLNSFLFAISWVSFAALTPSWVFQAVIVCPDQFHTQVNLKYLL